MTSIRLTDLADWPAPTASQGTHDRFRLLSTVAGRLGIVSRPPTPAEWQIASVSTTDLPALREAVDAEGQRTDRQRIVLGAGHRFQSIARHPARARQQLLDRIDAHLSAEAG
jgi:hypothetical protein